MINPNREIRPEDFAWDRERIFWTDHPEGRDSKREYEYELKELERLYHLQEEAKARAHFKREQARKELIPYSEALATEICSRISSGEFLTLICQDPDMPTVRLVTQWRKQHSDFAALHKEAVSDRLDIFEDEVVTIADDGSRDFRTITKGGKTTKVLDGEVISRAKLRVDVRRAHLKAYRPLLWGEASTLYTKSIDEIDNMSPEELEKKLAELETKQSAVKEPLYRSA
jgi:hypothetical protein